MGAGLGIRLVGCYCAIPVSGSVGTVMRMLRVGLAKLLMVMEKTAPAGRAVAAAAGLALRTGGLL